MNNLRELGSPNPVISFTWGCYRSLSGNRVADPGRATFWEKFVKKQESLGTRPIRPPQGRSKVGTGCAVTKHSWKKQVFFEKNMFFFRETRSAGTSWAPASQGRSHDATFYASCPGFLWLLHFTNFLIFLSCLGVPRSERSPERVFLHFFRKGFRTRFI